ncbi:holo-ACP synthase [Corynebacterium sphenisci]|nr:holo-ACP synthase [Corynebacterium sphenisci]
MSAADPMALARAPRGVGVDLVDVAAFAEQLDRPGTVFAERVFTPGELAAARARGLGGDRLTRHLAGRWAAKEAVFKAWSSTRFGLPPALAEEDLDWREIEIPADAQGRPGVRLHGAVAAAVAAGHPGAGFSVSISHDGDYAVAVAALTAADPDGPAR